MRPKAEQAIDSEAMRATGIILLLLIYIINIINIIINIY